MTRHFRARSRQTRPGSAARCAETDKRRAKAEGATRVGPYAKHRETVIGMVERNGRVIALHVPSRYGLTIRATIRDHVEVGCSLYTDNFGGYDGLGRRYRHQTINHSLRIYARGDVHTADGRRLLRVAKERHPGRLSLRLSEVATGLLQRVHVALQPPGRRTGDVPDAAPSCSAT